MSTVRGSAAPAARRRYLLVALAILLSACTSLQPVDLPPEYTPAPSNAGIWSELSAIRGDDWFVLLNDSPTALNWRLRAIDRATQSIDMQTFLWNLDTTGRLVFSHLLQAADRGVSIKLLVDDTFLLGEDQVLKSQPAESLWQRIEDWLFAHLPIEGTL